MSPQLHSVGPRLGPRLARFFAASLLLTLGLAQAPAQSAQPASTTSAAHAANPWWKHAFIYEIYPRSFGDSNGDGIGDLNGITEHLDYLQKLGVDAMWIAPMYPSPQVDFGYDISDYEAVDPQYGTLADFDHLEAAAGKRNIRVILDMVLNHTSDKSKWFIESATSRTNAKANWYVWNDGVKADAPGVGDYQKRFEHDGMVPPNNWESVFGGSAWEWVPARKQFYYHKFYKQQPDLNWRDPAVETACFNAMKFWLNRGVAGFRLDAIPTLFEDESLRNEPETGGINAQGDPNLREIYTSNLPEVHDVIRRMRAMVDKYPGDRVLIGETYLPNTAELDKWYGGEAKNELQLPMDMLVGFNNNKDYGAAHFRKYIAEAGTDLHGEMPLFVFDNHDNERSIDRYGDGVHNVAIAKTVAAMLFTTRAVAMSYYGAEIGMTTSTPTRKEDVRDPIGITGWPKEKGRDGERTPMQWTPGPQAGFSTDPHTWLPVATNYKTVDVQVEQPEAPSLLDWSEKLIALRRNNPAMHDGSLAMLDANNPNVLSYVRSSPVGGDAVVVAINMSAQPQTVDLTTGAPMPMKMRKTLLSSDNSMTAPTNLSSVMLPPFGVWIASVSGK
jgi:alpha-glucosidase